MNSAAMIHQIINERNNINEIKNVSKQKIFTKVYTFVCYKRVTNTAFAVKRSAYPPLFFSYDPT